MSDRDWNESLAWAYGYPPNYNGIIDPSDTKGEERRKDYAWACYHQAAWERYYRDQKRGAE